MSIIRVVVLLVALASASGCAPSVLYDRAHAQLGGRYKQLHLVDQSQLEGADIYTFCRNEGSRDVGNLLPIGERMYNGACVTYVCPAGDDGHRCT